jgi:hypothetical protein
MMKPDFQGKIKKKKKKTFQDGCKCIFGIDNARVTSTELHPRWAKVLSLQNFEPKSTIIVAIGYLAEYQF